MSQISAPLSQGVGYGVVIGVGLTFAAGNASNDILIMDINANRQA